MPFGRPAKSSKKSQSSSRSKALTPSARKRWGISPSPSSGGSGGGGGKVSVPEGAKVSPTAAKTIEAQRAKAASEKARQTSRSKRQAVSVEKTKASKGQPTKADFARARLQAGIPYSLRAQQYAKKTAELYEDKRRQAQIERRTTYTQAQVAQIAKGEGSVRQRLAASMEKVRQPFSRAPSAGFLGDVQKYHEIQDVKRLKQSRVKLAIDDPLTTRGKLRAGMTAATAPVHDYKEDMGAIKGEKTSLHFISSKFKKYTGIAGAGIPFTSSPAFSKAYGEIREFQGKHKEKVVEFGKAYKRELGLPEDPGEPLMFYGSKIREGGERLENWYFMRDNKPPRPKGNFTEGVKALKQSRVKLAVKGQRTQRGKLVAGMQAALSPVQDYDNKRDTARSTAKHFLLAKSKKYTSIAGEGVPFTSAPFIQRINYRQEFDKRFYSSTQSIKAFGDITYGYGRGWKERPLKTLGMTAAFTVAPALLGGIGTSLKPMASAIPRTAMVAKGAGIGLGAVVGGVYAGSVYGRVVSQRSKKAQARMFGEILSTEVTPIALGSYAYMKGYPKVQSYFRTRKLKQVRLETQVNPEVLAGNTRFPEAPLREHMKLFKEGKYGRLPGDISKVTNVKAHDRLVKGALKKDFWGSKSTTTSIDYSYVTRVKGYTKKPKWFGTHATDAMFDRTTITFKGSRPKEWEGMFISGYGYSPGFWRIGDTKYRLVGGSLFPSMGKPTGYQIQVAGFKYIPKGVKNVPLWSRTKAEKGYAYIIGKKAEVEAGVSVDTLLSISEPKYYTSYGGVGVPLVRGKALTMTGVTSSSSSSVMSVKQFKILSSSYRQPVYYSPSPLSYVSLIRSFTKPKTSSRSVKSKRTSSYLSASKTSAFSISLPSSISSSRLTSRSRVSRGSASSYLSVSVSRPSGLSSSSSSRTSSTMITPPAMPPIIFDLDITSDKKKKKKKKRKQVPGVYRPSFFGMQLKTTLPRAPKGILPGIGVRYKVK